MPGLMPDEPERYQSDLTVALRGSNDASLDYTVIGEGGLPEDLTGREFRLIITDCHGKETGADAVTISDPPSGTVTINFGASARGVVQVDDGMHKWVLAESTGGTDRPVVSGHIFRTSISMPY